MTSTCSSPSTIPATAGTSSSRSCRGDGYVLHDLHEHAFRRHGSSVAFASLESLAPFAGVDVDAVPVIGHGAIRYRPLELPDYLKAYSASLLDGYRRKRKDDWHKINLINRALRQGG